MGRQEGRQGWAGRRGWTAVSLRMGCKTVQRLCSALYSCSGTCPALTPPSPVGPIPSALMGAKLNCHTRDVSGMSAPSGVKLRSTKPWWPGSMVGVTRSCSLAGEQRGLGGSCSSCPPRHPSLLWQIEVRCQSLLSGAEPGPLLCHGLGQGPHCPSNKPLMQLLRLALPLHTPVEASPNESTHLPIHPPVEAPPHELTHLR